MKIVNLPKTWLSTAVPSATLCPHGFVCFPTAGRISSSLLLWLVQPNYGFRKDRHPIHLVAALHRRGNSGSETWDNLPRGAGVQPEL